MNTASELRQQALNQRTPAIVARLIERGFKQDSAISAYIKDGVYVYLSFGVPYIQRVLGMDNPYAHYVVKTVSTAHITIADQLEVPVEDTWAQLDAAISSVS